MFNLPIFQDISFFDTKNSSDPKSFMMTVDIDQNPRYTANFYYNVGYITNCKSKLMQETGSYIVIINSENGGPNAIYCISRSNKLETGNIKELIKSNGISNEMLDLEWNPYEYPLLKLKTNQRYKETTSINFYIKIITSF